MMEHSRVPSSLLPTFLQLLANPTIRTVMLCGCGGGFDFVHSLALYPMLRELGKQVVIGSYSFGEPAEIQGDAQVVFQEGMAVVKRVTAQSVGRAYYCPEVHVCSYLDQQHPSSAPHSIYAYYARAFPVPTLRRFYEQLVRTHDIDAIVLVDGGSDSLMAGDEAGLGDPIEDAVSVATVSSMSGLELKLLINIGLGADRYNDVSDAASLRAIAELTREGGYRGAMALEPAHPGFIFYEGCVKRIYEHQRFRSVLAGAIAASAQGWFGSSEVPPFLSSRVQKGQLFLWPLMPMLWAFDVDAVAKRSLLCKWIAGCNSVLECHARLHSERANLGLRQVENLPMHGR